MGGARVGDRHGCLLRWRRTRTRHGRSGRALGLRIGPAVGFVRALGRWAARGRDDGRALHRRRVDPNIGDGVGGCGARAVRGSGTGDGVAVVWRVHLRVRSGEQAVARVLIGPDPVATGAVAAVATGDGVGCDRHRRRPSDARARPVAVRGAGDHRLPRSDGAVRRTGHWPHHRAARLRRDDGVDGVVVAATVGGRSP